MFNSRIKKQINQLRQAVNQQTLHFRDLIAGYRSSERRGRGLYEVYGYPERYSYRLGYDAVTRGGMAQRIATGIPKSCWRNGFWLTEPNPDGGEPEKILTDELQMLRELDLFKRMERADVLNRIGNFSILLVGVPDGLPLSEPLGPVRGNGFNSLYFRPFSYDGTTVSQYDTDPTSLRYGMPQLYQLQVKSYGRDEKSSQPQPQIAHYSRIVHMVETQLDNDVEGIPVLSAIYNRLQDLDKVLGGSAEAYFRNARNKLAFEVAPEFSSDILNNETARQQFDEATKQFTDDWKDNITIAGAKVHSLDTPHDSPLDTARAILWEISGYTGEPIRVLIGEGSGQLAGSEDRLTRNAIVNDRQSQICDPWVRRVMSILDESGMIDLPDEYGIEWPMDDPLNAIDEAKVQNTQAQTLKTLTDAASTIGGDSIDLDSALDYFGLGEIDTDDELSETDEIDTMK